MTYEEQKVKEAEEALALAKMQLAEAKAREGEALADKLKEWLVDHDLRLELSEDGLSLTRDTYPYTHLAVLAGLYEEFP